jgi:hypothetical protein
VNSKMIDDMRSLELELRALKQMLRTRWERPMADEQRRVVVLRRKLTDLFITLAWSRARLHVRLRPRDVSPEAPWDPRAHAKRAFDRCVAQYGDLALQGAAP